LDKLFGSLGNYRISFCTAGFHGGDKFGKTTLDLDLLGICHDRKDTIALLRKPAAFKDDLADLTRRSRHLFSHAIAHLGLYVVLSSCLDALRNLLF
jgi:hypothetical protein